MLEHLGSVLQDCYLLQCLRALMSGGILRALSKAFAALMLSSEANNDFSLPWPNGSLAGTDDARLPEGTTTE
jgi:hypothetical protein